MNRLDLACRHSVYTEVLPKKQYNDDTHFVLCPRCRETKGNEYANGFFNAVPTAWQELKAVDSDATVPNVSDWRDFVLHRDILRIQPSIPKHRVRPFPYVNRRR